MMKTLLTSLSLLAVLLHAKGHGMHAGQPTARLDHPNPAATAAQDTSRLGSQRELAASSPALASAYSRTSRRPAATMLPTPPAAASAEAAETAEDTFTFDPTTAALPANLAIALRRPASPLGHRTYRTRLIRTGHFATHHEAVEILTCTYAGPLVLAQVPASNVAPALVLAGPGYDQAAALRPLALTQAAVLRLCGNRAPQVQAYARLYNLHFQQAAEVARLLDYYNRIAVEVR